MSNLIVRVDDKGGGDTATAMVCHHLLPYYLGKQYRLELAELTRSVVIVGRSPRRN